VLAVLLKCGGRDRRKGESMRLDCIPLMLLLFTAALPTDVNAALEDRHPFHLVASSEISSTLANYFSIEADTAYAVTPDGLEVFDIRNPRSPEKLGQFDFGSGFRIDVEAGHAYVLQGGTSGVAVIDIRSVGDYSVAGRYQTSASYTDIEVHGSYMYLVGRNEGLEIVDVSDPSSPRTVGGFREPGSDSQEWMGYSCLFVEGNTAFVGQSEHELKIVDISDRAHPNKTGAIPVDKHIGDVCARDSLLVMGATDELSLYNISDIMAPKRLSTLSDFSMLGYITLHNDKMAVYDDRIVLLDIADLRSPKVIGTLDKFSHLLRFHKGYLYSCMKGIEVFQVD
jgi:hypothetical protein